MDSCCYLSMYGNAPFVHTSDYSVHSVDGQLVKLVDDEATLCPRLGVWDAD